MEKSPGLDERSKSVLDAIIECYIQKPEPVGSRTLWKRFGLRLSPSSIRNVMFDLEDGGFILQPYASAGRIPTDKGYRHFVDHLNPSSRLNQSDLDAIMDSHLEKATHLGDLFSTTSNLLSDLSHHAGVVLISKTHSATLKRIQFIQLSGARALAVCVLGSELVQQKVIALDQETAQDELDRISNFINTHFVGFTLRQIRQKLVEQMKDEKERFDALRLKATQLSERILDSEEETGEVYLGGTINILDLPEFQEDVQKMKNIFQALEEKNRLVGILDKCLNADTVTIIIGSEITHQNMKDCSVVARTYTDHDRVLGTLGIIGSKRMDYQRSISLVNYMASWISNILSREKGDGD